MKKVIEVEPCGFCRKLIREGVKHECVPFDQEHYDSLSEAQQWQYANREED